MRIFKLLSNMLDGANKKDDWLEKKDPKLGKVRVSLGIIFLSIIVMLLTPLYLKYAVSQKPQAKFFAVNESKKEITKLDVLDLPVLSSQKVETWASRAIKNSYSFDFYNLDSKFSINQNYFTSDGWNAFDKALERAKVISNVRDNKLQVWLTPTSSAVITSIGKYGPYLVWRLEMPAIITYTGAAAPANQKVLVSVVVLQVPTTESPFGIQISQFDIN